MQPFWGRFTSQPSLFEVTAYKAAHEKDEKDPKKLKTEGPPFMLKDLGIQLVKRNWWFQQKTGFDKKITGENLDDSYWICKNQSVSLGIWKMITNKIKIDHCNFYIISFGYSSFLGSQVLKKSPSR